MHFVGIGGCGMSGLSRIAAAKGAICTGSDRQASAVTESLGELGINIVTKQTADAVPDDCQTVVVSAAIGQDHPEYVEAKRRGIEVVKYAQMLGRLMQGQSGVAIAGTHGKSTTTSMLSHVAIELGLDPSLIVGAWCRQIGGGSRVGESDLLIAEACEYDRSFHNLPPRHAAILNVEADHLDIYANLDEIVESFAEFARLIDPAGSLLIQHESPSRLQIVGGLSCDVATIGYAPQADWRIANHSDLVGLHAPGGALVGEFAPPLPGEHMAYNAAVALVMAHRMHPAWTDDHWPTAMRAIEQFAGLDRRMQRIGEHAGVLIIDDYGHHPTEIDTTLRALGQHYEPDRLICVFQPHQHSRTRFLLDQFAASFGDADIVIVPEIYFVRDSEQERSAVTSADLVDRLRHQGIKAMHMYPFDAIVEELVRVTRPGDLVVTMGAGNVNQIARSLLDALRGTDG